MRKTIHHGVAIDCVDRENLRRLSRVPHTPLSPPRKRGSKVTARRLPWTPAFAGVTAEFVALGRRAHREDEQQTWRHGLVNAPDSVFSVSSVVNLRHVIRGVG